MTYQSDSPKADKEYSYGKEKLALIQDYHNNFYDTYKELEKHYDLEMFGESYFKIPKDINNSLWETKQIGRLYLANPFTLYKALKGHTKAIIKDFSQPKSVIAILICRLLGIKYTITLQKMEWFNKRPLLLKLLIKLIIKKDTPIMARISEGYYQASLYFDNVTYVPFAVTRKIPNQYTKRDTIRVLCVGKLNDPNKNHVQLIKALDESDQRFELTIVGSMKKKTPYYYKLQKAMLSSMHTMYIQRDLSKGEIALEYMRADLFILPTIREPANYSVLEAMSYGLPVISSSGNGTASYLNQFYVFWANDKKSLKEILKRIVPNLKTAMNENLGLARTNHNQKLIVNKMLKVIQ